MKEYREKIETNEEFATNERSTKEDRIKKYTGKVFVVLKNLKDAKYIIRKSKSNICLSIMRLACPCFVSKKDLMTFERAPEPSDIHWQNLSIGPFRRAI